MTNTHGRTPLHISTKCSNLEAMNSSSNEGILKADKDGGTPLFLAAGHSKLEVFHFLRKIAADINIHDVQSNTVLQQAAVSISVEIIKILVEKIMSVDVTKGDDFNLYIFHLNAVIWKQRKFWLKEVLL